MGGAVGCRGDRVLLARLSLLIDREAHALLSDLVNDIRHVSRCWRIRTPPVEFVLVDLGFATFLAVCYQLLHSRVRFLLSRLLALLESGKLAAVVQATGADTMLLFLTSSRDLSLRDASFRPLARCLQLQLLLLPRGLALGLLQSSCSYRS